MRNNAILMMKLSSCSTGEHMLSLCSSPLSLSILWEARNFHWKSFKVADFKYQFFCLEQGKKNFVIAVICTYHLMEHCWMPTWQVDSVLPCVCWVLDHRWCQKTIQDRFCGWFSLTGLPTETAHVFPSNFLEKRQLFLLPTSCTSSMPWQDFSVP